MPARRLAALDALRGLAALGVLVKHVWNYERTGDPLADGVLHALYLGVPFFFALSGFLLFRPYVAAALDGTPVPRPGRYALLRAARVAPLYYVALGAGLLVLAGTGHPLQAAREDLLPLLTFTQNYVPSAAGKVDPPMWTLVIEVSFYAALPLLGGLAVRGGRPLAVTALAGGLGLAYCLVAEVLALPQEAVRTLPAQLPVFAAGMAAAVVLHRRAPSLRTSRVLLAAGAALVVAHGWWGELPVLRDLPAGLAFAAVIAACAAHPPRVLCAAPLERLGTWSFGVYLWHYPVILFLRTRGLWPEGDLVLGVAVVAPATLVLSALSWRLLEAPAVAWASRRGGGPDRAGLGAARDERRQLRERGVRAVGLGLPPHLVAAVQARAQRRRPAQRAGEPLPRRERGAALVGRVAVDEHEEGHGGTTGEPPVAYRRFGVQVR